MPQGVSENSLATNIYPLLPSNSQVVVQDDLGIANPIDVTDVAVIPHRELVNLENAAVNIDNSSDVIIGPVTQFNVNGNVIIRQHENGGRLGLGLDQDEEKDGGSGKDTAGADEPISRVPDPKTPNRKIKYTTWMSLGLVLIVVPTVIIKLQPAEETQTELPTIITSPTPTCKKCQQKYITKQTWHGSPPKSQTSLSEPAKMVVIKHTAGLFCTTSKDCSTLTKNIQDYHLFRGAPDIWYNFLVGGDGRIYEGRGFGVQNQFTNDTLDIAIHGNFSYDEFFPDMVLATRTLIEQGMHSGYLAKDYKVVCHNQTVLKTLSPGRNVYKHVITWDHYDNGTYFDMYSST